jgi:ectoine hydroxylase-related dioxygenase (phytanoyl-CoA dioxygenase family)
MESVISISEDQKKQYQEKGFFILDQVIPDAELAMIRETCDRLVSEQDAEMERLGTDELNLSRRGSRYFSFLAYQEHPELGRFIFSDLMAEVCRATIGGEALLFWDQFVVKGTSNVGKSTFSWHQDSGYVDGPHEYYVNAWVPLDDVNEENGTVYLLPFEHAGTRDRVEHRVDPETGDRVGYFGDESGVAAVCPAGSIVVFSSVTFHRSGPNLTDRFRRAYALQYAPEPVHNADGSIMGHVVPFLRNGERVR